MDPVVEFQRAPGAELATTRRPAVKVCGITRPEDALFAAALGADAIGLVFWPDSPRAVDLDRARAVARQVPPFVAVVGVFVNQSPAEILEVAAAVPLTFVQLHGDEADDVVISLPWRVLRAVPLGSPEAEARLARLPHTITVLLDAHDPRRRGGTGHTIDWQAAARVAARRRVILAGGLHAENVGDAVRIVRPWGLDVSSGVEVSPGVKDPDKLRAFFTALEGTGASVALGDGQVGR